MTLARALTAARHAGLALALASSLACASAPGPAPDPYAAPVLPLYEGATVTGEVAPGHPHVFPLPLEEGTYFEIHLDRSRELVRAYVFRPGVDEDSSTNDSMTASEVRPDGGQMVWEVATESGVHLLRLVATGGEPVSYQVTVAALRPGTEQDSSRHRGLETFAEAKSQWDADHPEEAFRGFEEAKSLFLQGGYFRGVAAASVFCGRYFQRRQRWADARQEFLTAREYWARGGDEFSVAGTLIDLAGLVRILGHWKEAEAFVDEAIERATPFGPSLALANAWSHRCAIYAESGRYDPAVAICQEAVDRQSEVGDPRSVIDALTNLGAVYRSRGELDEAAQLLSRAQEILAEHPYAEQEATVANDLALILDFQGQYLDALAKYREALASYEALGRTSYVGTVLSNMGTIYQRLGDWDATLEYYRQSLSRMRKAGEPVRLIKTLHNLGWAYIHHGMLDDARAALDEALGLAETLESAPLLAASHERIGELQLANRQPELAAASFDHALGLYHSSGSGWRVPSVLVLLARAQADLGDPDQAIELLAQAADLHQRIGRRSSVSETFFYRAEIEWRRGNLEAARRYIEEALADAESQRPRAGSDELRTLLSATTRPYYELFIDILVEQSQLAPGGGHDYEALRESERARARSLLEILPEADLDLGSEVPEDLQTTRTAIRNRLNATEIERQELLKSPNPEEGDLFRIKYDLEARLTELQEVERQIRLASPRYAALTRPEPVTVGEIQRSLLDSETSLLEYSLGEERSYLWVVTDNAFRTYELPGRAQIETEARCLHWLITAFGSPPDPEDLDLEGRACLGGGAERYEATEADRNRFRRQVARRQVIRSVFARRAERLSGILIAPPANDGLLRFRLAVVSDGALEYVPFAALPSPGTEHRPLVSGHELVRLPSASVLAFQRSHPPKPDQPERELAIVADPVYSAGDPRVEVSGGAGQATRGTTHETVTPMPSYSRLDFSGREAQAISALAPPGETLLLENLNANRSAVVGGALSGARYVHFATHGVIDTQYPQLSSLVLSLVDRNGRPDLSGFLRLHDIYGLDLDDAELVVLSACDTALGREVRGEGLVGLTRGFLYAGAERVVASLWQVQDITTASLMERFYRGLLDENRTPADALRRAQLETLGSRDGDYSFPYYWAGFVLQGEWR